MSRVAAFGRFWWEFVVGDDWLVAATVTLAFAATALLAHATSVPAWWLLPIAALGILALSLRRATR